MTLHRIISDIITQKQVDYINQLFNEVFGGMDAALKGRSWVQNYLKLEVKLGSIGNLSKVQGSKVIEELLELRRGERESFNARKMED